MSFKDYTFKIAFTKNPKANSPLFQPTFWKLLDYPHPKMILCEDGEEFEFFRAI